MRALRQPGELLEADIQRAIIAHLRSIPGIYVRKISVNVIPGRENASTGIPDLLVIIRQPDGRGDVWFIEVKRPGEKLRPSQQEFFAAWKSCGGNTIVATSVEDVIRQVPLPQKDLFIPRQR